MADEAAPPAENQAEAAPESTEPAQDAPQEGGDASAAEGGETAQPEGGDASAQEDSKAGATDSGGDAAQGESSANEGSGSAAEPAPEPAPEPEPEPEPQQEDERADSPKPLYSDPEDDGHVEGVGFGDGDEDMDDDPHERPSTAAQRAKRIASQLEEIDSQARARHEQGKHLEALAYTEQAMLLRKKFYGVGSPEMEKSCTTLVTDYNTVAMKILGEGQSGEARKLLAKAEKVTEPNGPFVNQHTRMKLRAVSFNNLGCYYKQLGKFHLALQYLKKADKIESRTPAAHNRAGTHLNLCAVLSQLGKHEVALRHAIAALEMLGNPNKSASASGKSELGIVAIAYHNLAVELECLKDYDSAKAAYLRALEVAKEDMGEDDPMTKQLQKAYNDAEKKTAGAPAKS